MNYTALLQLLKPVQGDVARVWEHISANSDILETFIAGLIQGTKEFDKIKLKIGSAEVLAPGEMSYDEVNGTLSVGLENGVTVQLAQEMHVRTYNPSTTDTMYDGRVVAKDGVLSEDCIGIQYALADGSQSPESVYGVNTQNILPEAKGLTTFFGVVHEINTTGADVSETWLVGDVLYVHPTLAGYMTKVPPTAPKPKIKVGMVLSVGATGSLFIRLDPGHYLGSLHDVLITTPASDDLLAYDSVNARWINVPKNRVFDFMTNIGDMMYASGASTPARLAAGEANKILKSGGTSNAPEWEDIGLVANALTAKETLVDADSIMIIDSADSNLGKKTTWAQIKTFLGGLFAPLASPAFTGTPTVSGVGRLIVNSASAGTALYYIWSGTQAEYNAIVTKDANTMYFIVG